MTDQTTVAAAAGATFDEADLAALRESIVAVLAEESGSLAVHGFIDGKNELDRTLWRHAGELGWLAVALPEAYGGLGMGVRGLDVLHHELGRHMAPGPFIATLSAAHALAVAGDDATKEAWLPRVAAAEISLAVPATLFGPRSDCVTMLGAADAAAALVPGEDGGWSLVALSGGAAPVAMWDRTRGVFDLDVSQLRGAALGAGAEEALAAAMALAISADSLGGARQIAEQTTEYLKTRVQFGKPVAAFQALKHRVVDLMAMATINDQVVVHGVEAVANGETDASIWAMMAKMQASDAYVATAADCIQLHGGVGFTWEFDPHIHLKRAQMNAMLVATNAALCDRAAARLAEAARAGRDLLELPAA